VWKYFKKEKPSNNFLSAFHDSGVVLLLLDQQVTTHTSSGNYKKAKMEVESLITKLIIV
jgi:hypothetical protein